MVKWKWFAYAWYLWKRDLCVSVKICHIRIFFTSSPCLYYYFIRGGSSQVTLKPTNFKFSDFLVSKCRNGWNVPLTEYYYLLLLRCLMWHLVMWMWLLIMRHSVIWRYCCIRFMFTVTVTNKENSFQINAQHRQTGPRFSHFQSLEMAKSNFHLLLRKDREDLNYDLFYLVNFETAILAELLLLQLLLLWFKSRSLFITAE